MAGMGKRTEGLKATMAMVMVQVVSAGVNIFYILASEDGMDLSILLAYRFLVGTALLASIALIFERGLLSQHLYLKGLVLTSVTVASAFINLIPAITFILALLFRMEKLALRTSAGKAKLAGTLVGIVGAMVITLYKGREINLWPSTHIHLNPHHAVQTMTPSPPPRPHHVLGALLCLASSALYSGWFIIQAKISKSYPCFYSNASLMCFMSTIQCFIFALIFDHRWDDWKLGWNIRLLSIFYIGIITGMTNAISTWCVKVRGPLFVSVFGPLMLVIVSILGSLILGQHLHLGSVIGGVIIVAGLYLGLWGKMKEAEVESMYEPALLSP